MLWPKILEIAAAITSVLSLCAFLGALFVWFSTRKRESSILQRVKQEGIANAKTVIEILKAFESDQIRLEALQQVLGYDRARSEGVLKKMKPEIGAGRFSLSEQVDLRKRLLMIGIVLVALAMTAALASRKTGKGGMPPDKESQTQNGQQPSTIRDQHEMLPSEARASARRQIVMLSVDGGCSAGIIVGYDERMVYIATAAHIAALSAKPSPPVTLRFEGFLQSRRGTFLPQFKNPDAGNLAVVTVGRDDAINRFLNELDFALLSPVPLGPPDAPVTSIGCYGGAYWSSGINEALVTSALSKDYLQFESNVGVGQSGGGLYNEAWELIGMPLVAGPNVVYARPITAILDDLRKWGIPVRLTSRPLEIRPQPASVQPPADRSPQSRLKTYPTSVSNWVEKNKSKTWFYPLSFLASALVAYVLGSGVLVSLAWKHGSRIFAKNWVTAFVSKPLTTLPRLGTWALFLGYRQRLLSLRPIQQVSGDYFGLPAIGVDGTAIPPDALGETLHAHIEAFLGAQQPVFISGSGGAGKTSILARLAYLVARREGPATLKDFRPILVSANYYETDLIQAIAATLRDRDGIAADSDIVRAQLQTGRFLVLFDGTTELQNGDHAFRSLLQASKSADYSNSRFILAGRSPIGAADEVRLIELQPLNSETISNLLSRYQLGSTREQKVRRQLGSFGSRPVLPLLFAMAIEQSKGDELSDSRAYLYELYFRRLLRVQGPEQDFNWGGWRLTYELIAKWLLIDSGVRGQGMSHAALVDRLTTNANSQASEAPISRVARLYGVQFSSAIELLQKSAAAGILEGGRRWRFAHDTFEEFFAASWIASCLAENNPIEINPIWLGSPENVSQFSGVVQFCKEMCASTELTNFLAPITGEIPQHPPSGRPQDQSRLSPTAPLKGVDRSALRFGLTLGWQLGRYEFAYNAPISEANALQPSLEAEIKNLLTADGYPQSIAGLTFEQLARHVLIFYELTSLNKHAAILIGNSAFRVSLIGASKDQPHNDEMKTLAFSSLGDIDPAILRHKEKFFDLLLQRKPHSIVELLEVIDSFTD